MAKEQFINRAQEEHPAVTGNRPAGRASSHEAGEERKYSNKAWTSEREHIGSTSKAHVGADLGAAVEELHDQHPHKHHHLGPHHGQKHHIRHEPLHGLHPKRSHGR